MTQEQKAKQAWINIHKGLDYIQGREDFKSSLKREIEKRITLKVKEINESKDPIQKTALAIRADECKRFLELLNTVEP
jgi:hypothetical protein